MSGNKMGLLAFLAVIWLANDSLAQGVGVVPGGWAPQFNYQTFSGPGMAGGSMGFNYGYGGYGYGYGPGASFNPYAAGLPAPPSIYAFPPSSQTGNNLVPLVGAIKRSTNRRNSR